MKCVIVFSLILTIVEICMSTATEIFYVLPDNSTNASCPSQPCATLNQYWLHNGTLPVVSNVEYHFLPGEHHVPANMMLLNLHNFSIIGAFSNSSLPTVLIGCSQSFYVIYIYDSFFVSITNVKFKHCSILPSNVTRTNLKLFCCFSCKIENVTFVQYGIVGFNLIGRSYLNNIKVVAIQSSKVCCKLILLQYSICLPLHKYNNHMHDVTINQLLIQNYTGCNTSTSENGLHIDLDTTMYHVNMLLTNSKFHSMNQPALVINNRYSRTMSYVFIINCTFELNTAKTAIRVYISLFNKSVSFINCEFHDNTELIRITIVVCRRPNECELIVNAANALISTNKMLTNISLVRCQFISNSKKLIVADNGYPILSNLKANIMFESIIIISHNYPSAGSKYNIISITTMNVRINGTFNVTNNQCRQAIVQFWLCDILFSGTMVFIRNDCKEVISTNTHIKVMEHTNMTFFKNKCENDVILVETSDEYYQPYPFCLFQYITMNNDTETKDLLAHYAITFKYNYKPFIKYSHIINLNTSKSPSRRNYCTILFCRFISHCKWLSSGAFYNYTEYTPEVVNHKVVQNDDENCDYNKHICYCDKKPNCSINVLGAVYPGQTLQTNLCNICSNDDSIVLYAEVNSINLPSSICKIVHQSQLVNVIDDYSNTVNYTIASNTTSSGRCELFLTASPFLNKVYDTFYVQLLPCPVGFTLQHGICDCDPILLNYIDKCDIDYSTIGLPANTWITAHTQANDTKYLISDCPMDYCLSYSSNVNLLYPDLQCQFNRTGILCSQCQHHLSMVLGSSRCMKCTNLHILITIIVIVAGIVLVTLLYILNFTVTIGTISGIIFYANVVSINDSVFFANDRLFKPLRVFISFTNLDLGIETCFYNGMDNYYKILLQLFFPFYLIIIAVSIITASRYSTRILRLTYTRSLPVLATLFLLSYTGVLRTVLTVLFSYSTITHLPSGHQQIVWSIDASVPLFGLKFTILFITCLMLFLLLIPFNITLLFTRYLLRFRLINHFKPILDAFQGTYKDKHYYWVGVHITLRSIFFALYGFQTKLRLLITTMILVLFIAYHSHTYPHKNKLVNIQELFLLLNLTIMYAASYQCSESVFSIVTNIMISLAFIQFCTIVLYHFLMYTYHCNIVSTLQNMEQAIMKYFTKDNKSQNSNHQTFLDIPECRYNYSEYQDGLISDDFK